jgi:hypothetical protein
MEEKFLDILGNIWGTDIAYQESQEQIDLIMKAMTKAYELGNKTNDIHSVMCCSMCDSDNLEDCGGGEYTCLDCGHFPITA